MERRDFLKASLGISFIAFTSRLQAINSTAKPNLLIIQTDEHNFRTLGCYRKTLSDKQALVWGKDAVVETPNIDWIAENGALCEKFYATTPVCSPSRAAFVSGQYPQNTPVYTNNVPLKDNIVTFAEILGRNGYSTGYAGKWHLDGFGKPQWGPERKFGFADNRYMFNRGHWKKLEDTKNGPRVAAKNKAGKPSYDVDGADEKSFATDFLADKTVEFIEKNANKPFCYMVSIPDPHGPNTVRKPYDTMYKDMVFTMPATASKPLEGLPSWSKKATTKVNQKQMAQYFGMVKCIDDNVGKILDCLRKNKILDNTIVVFTADHGDLCGEHGRHNKGVVYEGSAKVPFVMYYQGKVKAGTVVKEAIGCVDFLPTVLELMNVKTAGKEEGRSYAEMFVKGKTPVGWEDIIFVRGTGKDEKNWIAAITKRYKLVYAPNDKPWLFDLEKDPDELVNFYDDAKYLDITKKMAKSLLEYGDKYNDPRVKHESIKSQLKNRIG